MEMTNGPAPTGPNINEPDASQPEVIIPIPYATSARLYWSHGWTNPIPVRGENTLLGKDLPVKGYTGYQGRAVGWADLERWTGDAHGGWNVALRSQGSWVGIDVDAYDGKQGAATLAAAQAELGALPPTISSTSRGPGPSRIKFFRVPPGTRLAVESKNLARFGKHIEIVRHDHRYAVVWPSIHPDTGAMYRWWRADETPWPDGDVPHLADAAELPARWLEFLCGVEQGWELPEQRASTSMPDTFADFDMPERVFTAEQAVSFARSSMDALRRARRGEINNRLNDAAIMLSHFTPAFWSEKQATEWLIAAQRDAWIASGGRDDKDYSAALATINSAFGARTWKATKVEPPSDLFTTAQGDALSAVPPEPDRVKALLDMMLTSEELDDIAPLEPLVEGWLFGDTIARLNGKPGSLKTFLALDLAGCIGAGLEWHNFRVWQGPVVYLVAEGAHGIRARVRAWEKHRGTPMKGVHFLPAPVQTSSEDWMIFIEACRQLEPVLIVLDTQARITVGLEENSAKEMGEVVDRLERLRAATRACVLLVHHLGHNGEHGRGSTAVPGALQTELLCEKDVAPEGGLVATLKTSKQKDSEELAPLALRASVVTVGTKADGAALTSLVLDDGEITLAVGAGRVTLDEELASMGGKDAMARLMVIMRRLFAEGAGGTEAEIRRFATRDKDDAGQPKAPHMGISTFRRTWNRAVTQGCVARVEGTQRWLWRHDPESESGWSIEDQGPDAVSNGETNDHEA